ncbi:hypothetical protein AN220_27065 [Streptomyces nanshensis]|nr:hypothetical protein AN220_27065 [Streptomyces nanshensis]
MQQAEAVWSMIPQGMPTKSFSARWHSRASCCRDSSSPYSSVSASPVTTSRAADEESPAPVGTVLVRCTSAPPTGSPASRSAQPTPAG